MIYLNPLYKLIDLYERKKTYNEVKKRMKEAIEIQTANFSKAVFYYSEKELSQYINIYPAGKTRREKPGIHPAF